MGRVSSVRAQIKRKVKEQSFQERSFVAFKVGLSVSLGTLVSLTPGYASLWHDPVSLADQVIFTVLGGANLTVGGGTEQFLWRFVIGALAGTAAFSAIDVLGGAPVAQGIIFFLIVFGLTLIRVKIPKSDIGITFATLASVYAVDTSYRNGNLYKVDTDALTDLLRSWAFGTAISLTVNFLVLPVKASRLARDRTIGALSKIHDVMRWLLATQVGEDIPKTNFTAGSVRKTLYEHGDTLSRLQSELAWEIGWSASSLVQRAELLDAVISLQRSLVVAARDGPFVSDLPDDLAGMIRPAVSFFTDRAFVTLEAIVSSQRRRRDRRSDDEFVAPSKLISLHTQAIIKKAASDITSVVITTLRSVSPSTDRLASLDRATHCLDTVGTLADYLERLEHLAALETGRRRRLQFYVLNTIFNNFKDLFRLAGLRKRDTAAPPSQAPTSFVPPVPFSHRVLRHATSSEARYAFKVASALSCLLAILWAPTSRSFFLEFTVRNSTVPLLLALMPTVGLSVLSWVGQLSGAVLGTMWACLCMVIWRGVGKQAYCVPGLFFFEWFLCLAVGWRMLTGPDFLAVTSMNACAIWQLTGTPGEQPLGLHLGYMLTTAAIAIAFAIPFQLLIFPRHARNELRAATAASLRQLSRLALDEVDLSSAVLFSEDAEAVALQAARLDAEISTLKAGLREQDTLVDMAAAEWSAQDGFQAERAHALVEALHRCADTMAAHIGLCAKGLMDARIRNLLGCNNEHAAHGFAEACSTVFWCLGASWTLFEAPPAPLPAVDEAGSLLLRELEQPPREQDNASISHSGNTPPDDDLRRWWSLTLTLVTQRAEIGALMRIMSPQWDVDPNQKRPVPSWRMTGLSEEIKSEEVPG